MKKYLRNVHVDGRKWTWYVRASLMDHEDDTVIIFSPGKRRHLVPMSTFEKWKTTHNFTMSKGIGPGDVKGYIQDQIENVLLEDGPVA